MTAVQSEYSLWWRRPEEGVLAACEELTAVSDSIEIVGGRYPDALDAQTNL